MRKENQALCRATGLLPILALALASSLLGSACGGGKGPTVGVDGWMNRMAFSEDGRYLLALYGHVREVTSTGIEYSKVPDTLALYEVGSWDKVMEYTSAGRIWRAYTCADPDVVLHTEDRYPDDETNDLVFRSISTKQEISRLAADHLPHMEHDAQTYFCDLEGNVIYMDITTDRVTAVDGSTGQVVREYIADNIGYKHHLVQKERDRLVIVDEQGDFVWIYSLSTAELLGVVDVWPWFRVQDLPVDHLLIDEDTMLYLLVASKDSISGVYFFLIDLMNVSVENESVLPDCYYWDVWYMETGTNEILLNFLPPGDSDGAVAVVDFIDGVVEQELSLSWHGQGQVFPIPEIDRIYIDDWLALADRSARAYSYPNLELLHQGPAPNDSEEKQWVSNKQLIVMESYFSDRFGLYDPVSYEVVDDFHICTQVSANSLRIDPTGRWAAVMCFGKSPVENMLDLRPGMVPDGAGVAVVDLERYR